MHPALAVLIAVIVIAIIYLIVSGGPNKSFIDSVATAKTACDAAVASQKDADFVSAINAITAAKIARSASLNQYVNKPIPADVSAASTKLDGLMCRNHAGDVAAIQAVTTAKAAYDVAMETGTQVNIDTSNMTYQAAVIAVRQAVAAYPANAVYVTPALNAAIETLKTMSEINILQGPPLVLEPEPVPPVVEPAPLVLEPPSPSVAPVAPPAPITGTISVYEGEWQNAAASCPVGKTLRLTSFNYGGDSCPGFSDADKLALLQSNYARDNSFNMGHDFNSALGDPCFGVYKQFNAAYECI